MKYIEDTGPLGHKYKTSIADYCDGLLANGRRQRLDYGERCGIEDQVEALREALAMLLGIMNSLGLLDDKQTLGIAGVRDWEFKSVRVVDIDEMEC